MTNKKALIAMSGGVDSSVAAWLTQQAGFSCSGAMMHLHRLADTADAQAVADRLGFPLHILDFTSQFHDIVISDFIGSYEAGHTPNPCVLCNKALKFGILLDAALDLGCDRLITGHYARIRKDAETGRFLLCKATDKSKDQSYFLYSLDQHQLSHSHFPLGEIMKEQARQIALEQGFVNAEKKDSQDICFIPDGNYTAFLETERGSPYPTGSFLDLNGHTVGAHRGAVAYTRGQRKGLGLALGEAVYVCSKNMRHNTVTVGPDAALFSRELLAEHCNWIAFEKLTGALHCKAKARSRMTEQAASVYPLENGRIRVVFDEPQRALTTGQAVVFYHGDTVLGGGTISEIL